MALEPAAPEYIPVARYGRHTLVELAPTAAQRDLLLQTIDASMTELPEISACVSTICSSIHLFPASLQTSWRPFSGGQFSFTAV